MGYESELGNVLELPGTCLQIIPTVKKIFSSCIGNVAEKKIFFLDLQHLGVIQQ